MRPGAVLAASVVTQATVSAMFQGLPALGPALQTTFGLTTATVGIMLGCVSVGASTVVIFWGRLLDRTTDRFIAAVGLFGAAILLICAAFAARMASEWVTAVCLVAAGGLAVAPSLAITSGMARAFKGTKRFGLAFGIRQAAVPVGGVLASVTLPVIAYSHGLSLPFVVLAIAMAVSGIYVLFVIRHGERTPRSAQLPSADWHRIIPLLVSCALYTFTQIGILALLTLFLFNERGWDPRTAALIYSIVMASAIGSRIAVGHLADRLVGGALRIYRVIGIVTALLLIASAATVHFSVVVPLIVLAAISGMTWNPLIFALTVQAVPPARLGATQGVVTSVIFLGAGLAPIVIAPITSATSWSVGWLILALACVVGAVIARVGPAQSR